MCRFYHISDMNIALFRQNSHESIYCADMLAHPEMSAGQGREYHPWSPPGLWKVPRLSVRYLAFRASKWACTPNADQMLVCQACSWHVQFLAYFLQSKWLQNYKRVDYDRRRETREHYSLASRVSQNPPLHVAWMWKSVAHHTERKQRVCRKYTVCANCNTLCTAVYNVSAFNGALLMQVQLRYKLTHACTVHVLLYSVSALTGKGGALVEYLTWALNGPVVQSS